MRKILLRLTDTERNLLRDLKPHGSSQSYSSAILRDLRAWKAEKDQNGMSTYDVYSRVSCRASYWADLDQLIPFVNATARFTLLRSLEIGQAAQGVWSRKLQNSGVNPPADSDHSERRFTQS